MGGGVSNAIVSASGRGANENANGSAAGSAAVRGGGAFSARRRANRSRRRRLARVGGFRVRASHRRAHRFQAPKHVAGRPRYPPPRDRAARTGHRPSPRRAPGRRRTARSCAGAETCRGSHARADAGHPREARPRPPRARASARRGKAPRRPRAPRRSPCPTARRGDGPWCARSTGSRTRGAFWSRRATISPASRSREAAVEADASVGSRRGRRHSR